MPPSPQKLKLKNFLKSIPILYFDPGNYSMEAPVKRTNFPFKSIFLMFKSFSDILFNVSLSLSLTANTFKGTFTLLS